jgi:hypothetical protein
MGNGKQSGGGWVGEGRVTGSGWIVVLRPCLGFGVGMLLGLASIMV